MVQKIMELARMGAEGGPLAEMLRGHGLQLRIADGVGDTGDIDNRYFPSEKTVRNISQRAIRGQRLHEYDQPAVANLNEMEKAAHPGDNWFFRPSSGEGGDFLLVHQTADQRRMLQVGSEGVREKA